MYEATLVANDTPFDRFREGDSGALSEQAHATSRVEREAATRERSSTAAVRSRTTTERFLVS